MGQEKIQTSELDELSKEGLPFTRHYAGAPVCAPSCTTLMTGMSQAIVYIKGNPGGDWRRENLPDQEVTIAERLKTDGYETVCIGKWGLGRPGKSGYPLHQGFDHFIGYATHRGAHNYYPETLYANNGNWKNTAVRM